MANENENTKPGGTENTGESQHHRTWKDIIHEEAGKIDSEFPLSGGETEDDFSGSDDEETSEGNDKASNEPHEHHSIMENLLHKIQNLDTEFPLSGGETDEDFEGIDDEEEGEEK